MKSLPYVDFTLKARVRSYEAVEEALLRTGFGFIGTDHQQDTYFEVERGKLKYRQGSIETLITHYERVREHGAEKTIVYRYDEQPSTEMVQQLYATYQAMGTVQKSRRIYRKAGLKVHLDTLPDGQQFIEIEAFAHHGSASLEELESRCQVTRQALGLASEDLLPTGYFAP